MFWSMNRSLEAKNQVGTEFEHLIFIYSQSETDRSEGARWKAIIWGSIEVQNQEKGTQ